MGYARWHSGTRRRWDEFFKSPRSIWRLFEGGPNEDVNEGLPIVGRDEFLEGESKMAATATAPRKRTYNRYEPRVIARAVREVLDESKHINEVAKECGIVPSTLSDCVKKERKKRRAAATPNVATHPSVRWVDGKLELREIVEALGKIDIDTFFAQDELVQEAIVTLRNRANVMREVRLDA